MRSYPACMFVFMQASLYLCVCFVVAFSLCLSLCVSARAGLCLGKLTALVFKFLYACTCTSVSLLMCVPLSRSFLLCSPRILDCSIAFNASVSTTVYVYLCVSVCVFAYFFGYAFLIFSSPHPRFCQFQCLSACLSVFIPLAVCLSVCLSVYLSHSLMLTLSFPHSLIHSLTHSLTHFHSVLSLSDYVCPSPSFPVSVSVDRQRSLDRAPELQSSSVRLVSLRSPASPEA